MMKTYLKRYSWVILIPMLLFCGYALSGELGGGAGSSFPGALDTDNSLEVDAPNAGKTKARAAVPNDLAAAIVSVQTELGTDPAGTLTNVKTFLQTEHNTNGTHVANIAKLNVANVFTAKLTITENSGIADQVTINGTGANGVNLKLSGDGAGAKSKTIRVKDAKFAIVNDAYTAEIVTWDDTGKQTAGIVPLARLSAADANAGYPQSGTGGEVLRTIRGRVSSAGTILGGSGFTVTKGAAGVYTINFSTAFAATPTLVGNTIDSNQGIVHESSTSSASSIIMNTRNLAGTAADMAFGFIVIGPA